MTIASYYTLIGMVLIQLLGVCLPRVGKIFSSKWNAVCCRKIEREDDWEPYMLAALQREEEESENDENINSHSSGSIESLPTYPLHLPKYFNTSLLPMSCVLN